MDRLAELSPRQHEALTHLGSSLPLAPVALLHGDTGMGKTSVLRHLQHQHGGGLLDMSELLKALQRRHPLALEEAFFEVVSEALRAHHLVLIDDLHLLANVVSGFCQSYPRGHLLEMPCAVLAAAAGAAGKTLVFATSGHVPGTLTERGLWSRIEDFEPDDYEHVARAELGEPARALDWSKVHRFAPALNGYQLRDACRWVARSGAIDAERFIEYLRERKLSSNVHLGEVARVELTDLIGVDDVIRSLEANVIVPLENDALSSELDLKPKRGVLLAGPPGTGKTSVGRALAHRLRGKFFLIDGTFISGTQHFYRMVSDVFEAAKENAPSVIFIDDSDVIFESGEEHGLYRYLLTMLDGLESKSNARVCVMLTAMEVGNLPPALIRSGRVELWLEMRLPDANGRAAIVAKEVPVLPAPLRRLAIGDLAAATDGFTGADLKRTVEDAKLLYAHDRARQARPRPPTEYFLEAAATIRANRERYARAEAKARQGRPARPAWFDVPG